MKKNRMGAAMLVVLAAVCATIASCNEFNLEGGLAPGKISLAIGSVPDELVSDGTFLKSGTGIDTNSFILTINSTSGEKIYEGTYGARPVEIVVTPGSYEVALYSCEFNPPAYSSPLYGDKQTVVVEEGSHTDIVFMCKQLNAGVRFKFSNDFIAKFPGNGVVLEQQGARLEYDYWQTKYAFVSTESFNLLYNDGEKDTTLLTKNLGAGQMVTMNLSFTSNGTTAQVVKVEIDTTREWISYDYNLGMRIPTGALSIEEAKQYIGERVQVFGYIVGGDPSTSSIRIGPPFESKSAFVIASAMTERNRNNMFVVELPTGVIRDALNLVNNPHLLGTAVLITGTVTESYFGYIGIKNTKSYSFL